MSTKFSNFLTRQGVTLGLVGIRLGKMEHAGYIRNGLDQFIINAAAYNLISCYTRRCRGLFYKVIPSFPTRTEGTNKNTIKAYHRNVNVLKSSFSNFLLLASSQIILEKRTAAKTFPPSRWRAKISWDKRHQVETGRSYKRRPVFYG